jgi:hypothetical protein
VVVIATVIVSEPTIAGDDVKYHLTPLKIEAEFQLAKTCRAHHFP